MAEETLIPLGPWRGINNVEDDASEVYVGKKSSVLSASNDKYAYLRQAVNVDLDQTGWIRRRAGRTKLATMTDAHSLASIGGRLFCVDQGDLYQITPGATATGTRVDLVQSAVGQGRMSYAEAGGAVYWCNGEKAGRIINGSPSHWGMEPPGAPLLSQTAGNLPAGRYLAAVTFEDSNGLESGARQIAAIELTDTAGIRFAGLTVDPDAAFLNIYLSATNGQTLYWAGQVPASLGTFTLMQPPESTDALDTFGLYPPPQGARLVRFYRGRALVVADQALYWSQPLAFHHFDLARDVQLFAEPPVLLEPLSSGFYLAEGTRTYWVAGDDPENWQPREVDDRQVAAGPALRIPGDKIPSLQTSAMVLIWATETGPVAGLEGGQVVHLTEDAVAMDAHSLASLSYREQDGLAQVLMQLRDRNAVSGFAASDRIDATIIKGAG